MFINRELHPGACIPPKWILFQYTDASLCKSHTEHESGFNASPKTVWFYDVAF